MRKIKPFRCASFITYVFTKPIIGRFSETRRRCRGPIVAEPGHERRDQRRRRGERGNGGVLDDADHGGDPGADATVDGARHQPGKKRKTGEIEAVLTYKYDNFTYIKP